MVPYEETLGSNIFQTPLLCLEKYFETFLVTFKQFSESLKGSWKESETKYFFLQILYEGE